MPRRRAKPNPHARIPLHVLASHRSALWSSAYAPNTSKTYRQAQNTYSLFSADHQTHSRYPRNIHQLTMFISYLSYRNFSPNTIITYASAMAQCTLIATGTNLTAHFLCQKLFRALRRQKVPDIRRRVTPAILLSLISACDSVCYTACEASLFKVAFSLAFHALLRVSECCSTSKGTHTGIRAQHVKLLGKGSNRCLKLTIPQSKNDQYGKKCTIKLNCLPHQSKIICSVRLMVAYLKVRPAFKKNQPLFIHGDGSSLTQNQFASVMKQALHFSQVPEMQSYSSHSFRIGGATTLAERGIPEEDIQAAGRWRSQAYKSYIRFTINHSLGFRMVLLPALSEFQVCVGSWVQVWCTGQPRSQQ